MTSCKSKDKTSIKSWHLIHHIRTIQHGVGGKLVLLIWYRVINISDTKMRKSPLPLADQMENRMNWTLSYWWFIESFYSQSLSHKTVFTHFQMLWMSQRYEYIGTKKPRLSLSAPFFLLLTILSIKRKRNLFWFLWSMLTDTSKGWRIHSTSIKAANKRKMRGVQTDLKRSCQNQKKKFFSNQKTCRIDRC